MKKGMKIGARRKSMAYDGYAQKEYFLQSRESLENVFMLRRKGTSIMKQSSSSGRIRRYRISVNYS